MRNQEFHRPVHTIIPGAENRSWMTLVFFRTRRRDECLELKEGLGRRVRKSRQKEAAGVCGGRGVIYGISIDFRPESLARSGIRQKGSY